MISQFTDLAGRQALNQLSFDVSQAQQVGSICPVGSATAIMSDWINRFSQLVESLQQRYLYLVVQLGEPAVRQIAPTLDLALKNLAGNVSTYRAMYQNMLQEEQKRARIVADANAFATANVLGATQHSNAVFNGWVQGMFDVNENRCYDCHQPINVPGGGYCLECARRRGLIW